MTRPVPAPICRCCGKPRTRRKNGCWRGAHGWCGTCSNLWYAQGKPEGGPRRSGPERIRRIRATSRAAQLGRLTDYAWLRSFGESREQAAARVGVSQRWARRVYDRMLADQEAREASSAA